MCRSSLQQRAVHESCNKHQLKLKEAEQLIRGATSRARLATSLLQSVTKSSTTTKPSDPGDVPFEAVLVFAAIADVEPNPTAAGSFVSAGAANQYCDEVHRRVR